MTQIVTEFTATPPQWCCDLWKETASRTFTTDEEKARFAIELARLNVANATGGPFGAAVFSSSGRLVAPGVNRVVPCRASMLHAEVMACLFAQQSVGHFTLRDEQRNLSGFELFTSTEPCAMCYGAVVWAGIDRLVCCARESDARDIGFEEGPKAENWAQRLHQEYAISVVTDVCRAEAIAVLRDYMEQGHPIYNGATAPST